MKTNKKDRAFADFEIYCARLQTESVTSELETEFKKLVTDHVKNEEDWRRALKILLFHCSELQDGWLRSNHEPDFLKIS